MPIKYYFKEDWIKNLQKVLPQHTIKNENDLDNALKILSKTYNCGELERMIGFNKQTIRNHLVSLKIERRSPGGSNRKHFIQDDEEYLSLSEFAKKINVPYYIVYDRRIRLKWSIKRIKITPVEWRASTLQKINKNFMG